MVLATLKDGRVIGGFYGRDSFAAYAKDGRDLYLQQRWTLDSDNWFEQPANDTHGLWIPTEEVVSLELYDPDDSDAGDQNGGQAAAQSPDATAGQP